MRNAFGTVLGRRRLKLNETIYGVSQMRIATVNGIRSRLPSFLEWLQGETHSCHLLISKRRQ
jgi:hypothetical protein